MNKLIELKGKFDYCKNTGGGSISLPKLANEFPLTIKHLNKLYEELIEIRNYWEVDTFIRGALITVNYREIVAKSNRLSRLLKEKSTNINNTICGIKFNFEKTKHIFTYFISLDSLNKTLDELYNAIIIFKKFFGDCMTKNDMDNIDSKFLNNNTILTKTVFKNIMRDCFYVEKFLIETVTESIDVSSLVTIYKTNLNVGEILTSIGITIPSTKILDEFTIFLTADEFELLKSKAPYLISMKTSDLNEIEKIEIKQNNDLKIMTIPDPTNEPIIGVIDTLFDKNVYFSNWVEYTDKTPDFIEKKESDYYHGTSVSSIIVDGPMLNPRLDDGCGRFRVRHFGVMGEKSYSLFELLKQIKLIVSQNIDIKVWNLSLGSEKEINKNYISIEATILDEIQTKYDVVFIVSGTNKPKKNMNSIMKIGAPADSINSIVVNSVDFNNNPATYSRVGPVLSFFYKPDLSYYGGDRVKKDYITVFSNIGPAIVSGTSFAAPWIARKMGYLIDVMGFSREIAKALLIDSAAGWNRKDTMTFDIGYGVVPININDIIGSKNDEIKFMFTGATEEYETSSFNIPIPLNKDKKYPYISRATLCYFSRCSRNQGVDYTSEEIGFQFGRVRKTDKYKIKLLSLNSDKQEYKQYTTYEEFARDNYRKWDNIKHLADYDNNNKKAKKSYEGELCGIKMTVSGRLSSTHKTIPFGIVITLKELNGVNRASDFIKLCQIKGWHVTQVDIDNMLNIKKLGNENIEFE